MAISKDRGRTIRQRLNKSIRVGSEAAAGSLQAERDLLFGVLETLSHSRHMNKYLEQLVEHVKNYSGCSCVGIRLLDDNGNIPYIVYTGFSREFYESESPLCIKSDKCMCINVIGGNTKPSLPFFTDGGSFFSNGTTKLLTSVPKEVIGENRGVCNQHGYESLALVPMRHKNRILGLIHIADNNENVIPMEKVRFLERIGASLGEALHTFIAEEERKRLLIQIDRERHNAKKLAEALKKEKDILEVIMENTGAHLAYLDPDFTFVSVNSTYAKGSGHTVNELLGQNHFVIFSDEENQAIFEKVRDSGESVEFHDKPFEFEDQPWRGITYWDWTLIPVKDAFGRVQGLVLSLVDTTERKKLEQLKDEFIGLVSHELRSPLTVIMGAVNTALSEGARLSPEETRQLLQDAAWEVESMSHLVGNLLELSRVQAEQLLLYPEPVSLSNVVRETVNKMKQQFPAYQFLVDLPGRLPPVHADPLRLERILYNLLENAAKYSPVGSQIRIFAKAEKERLVIGLSDQGSGISLRDRDKIFGPFQRLETSRLSGVKGAGLGLLVCRRLVEAHGGQIWVESEPGQGSTFFFTLPFGGRERSGNIEKS